MKNQEKPVFESGDRFRLMRPIEIFSAEAGQTGYVTYSAGLKGTVAKKLIAFEGLPAPLSPVTGYLLRFEAFPGRLVVWVGTLEEVAAKAVEGPN